MLGFTSVELRDKETGKLLAVGTHTKALGAGTPTSQSSSSSSSSRSRSSSTPENDGS